MDTWDLLHLTVLKIKMFKMYLLFKFPSVKEVRQVEIQNAYI